MKIFWLILVFTEQLHSTFKCIITQSSVLFSSLIDRRGFLPPDEAIPATSASEMELPPFAAKTDTHMVG